MATINVANFAGTSEAVEKPNANGRAAASGSRPVALATEDLAAINAVTTAVSALVGTEYETVAASASDQQIGATGASGDLLSHLVIVPATTSPGAVSIKDGTGSAITVFAGGASSVTTLHPFTVSLGLRATGAGWKVTTGSNVSVIAAGNFT